MSSSISPFTGVQDGHTFNKLTWVYGCLIFFLFSPYAGYELEHLGLAFLKTQGFLICCTNLQYLIWGVNPKK